MKLTQRQKVKIAGLIEDSLNNAKLKNIFINDDSGDRLPLVDLLSIGTDISSGKEEIENIAEQIYFDMDSWNI